MTAVDVVFGLALGIGTATATALAYLAAPVVRSARRRPRRS